MVIRINTDLRRANPGKFPEAKTMTTACVQLREAGILRSTNLRTVGRGRKPLEYAVNPQFLRTPLDDIKGASCDPPSIDADDWSFNREEAR